MALQNEKNSRYLLRDWKPENPAFWENKGKHIARRNLWISVSCLLLPSVSGCYLAQLLLISIKSVLISLPINSFINRITLRFWRIIACSLLLYGAYIRWTPMDGFSTAILIIPCVWLGIAVQNPNTPFGIFIVIALLCGFAGANFASSMGNISFFFPKAKQGSALGINGGLGNLGVSVMQLVAPLVILSPYLPFSASMAYRRPTVR